MANWRACARRWVCHCNCLVVGAESDNLREKKDKKFQFEIFEFFKIYKVNLAPT